MTVVLILSTKVIILNNVLFHDERMKNEQKVDALLLRTVFGFIAVSTGVFLIKKTTHADMTF